MVMKLSFSLRLRRQHAIILPSAFQDVQHKTMTADNGPEFTTLSKLESLGTKVYFAHPYSSWERPQNERHNGLLREFIPKGPSIEQYTDDDILDMADTLNQRPRRIWDYHNPAELFEAFLDEVYAIDNIS